MEFYNYREVQVSSKLDNVCNDTICF